MAEGTIVEFDVEYGHGVIKTRDGRDRLPFDVSAARDAGEPPLQAGQRVVFEVGMGIGGRRAIGVTPVHAAPDT